MCSEIMRPDAVPPCGIPQRDYFAERKRGIFKLNSAWSSKGMTAIQAPPPLRGNPKRRQAARTPKTLTIERHNLLKNSTIWVFIYLYAIRI